MSTPYASAAALYRQAGWRDVIPVAGKDVPVTGFTGKTGAATTDADVMRWVFTHAGHNVGLRLVDVIGIDVDTYSGKVGAEVMAKAEAEGELGQLPGTWSSTSRGAGQPSRIRFFRLPDGVNLSGCEKRFKDAYGLDLMTDKGTTVRESHIEFLHFGHRYAIAWPSPHPQTGQVYRWYDAVGVVSERVPAVDELAWLPQRWLEFLLTGVKPNQAEPTVNPFSSPSAHGAASRGDERTFTVANAETFVAKNTAVLESLISEGNGRTEKLFNLATQYGHLVPGIWTAEDVEERLFDLADRNGYVTVHGAGEARTQIRNGLARPPQDNWKGVLVPVPPVPAAGTPDATSGRPGRRVALRPYLDGSYVAPKPSVGGRRTDGVSLLYPGRWHSLVGLTGAAKTWLAVWHMVCAAGAGQVVYCHYEETDPAGTLARAQALGCSADFLEQQVVWLDCSTPWAPGEFAAELAALSGPPVLAVLDGINMACSLHDWDVEKTSGVGAYRAAFVTPATALGAAVLSLGHPVKGRDRQTERHSFGSTAWLDLPDGVGFRMEAGRPAVGRQRQGFSNLYSVKDRYGEVEVHGTPVDGRDGWYYLGAFVLDDSQPGYTRAWLSEPKPEETPAEVGGEVNQYAELAGKIAEHLATIGREYASENVLSTSLKAAGLRFSNESLKAALEWLELARQLERPAYEARKPRPGKLISKPAPRSDLEVDEQEP